MGIIFVALGVSLCSKADLGVSMIAAPTFVIQEAVYPLWNGFSVGVVEYLVQGLVLLILCAMDSFLDRGGSILDTAAVYGMGVSEQTIGEWMKSRKLRTVIVQPSFNRTSISCLSSLERC